MVVILDQTSLFNLNKDGEQRSLRFLETSEQGVSVPDMRPCCEAAASHPAYVRVARLTPLALRALHLQRLVPGICVLAFFCSPTGWPTLHVAGPASTQKNAILAKPWHHPSAIEVLRNSSVVSPPRLFLYQHGAAI